VKEIYWRVEKKGKMAIGDRIGARKFSPRKKLGWREKKKRSKQYL